MSFATTMQDDAIVISAPESFDFRLMRDFHDTAGSAMCGNGNQIVVDLSQTTHLDTSALAMLLVLRDRARSSGKAVVLTRPIDRVKALMDLAHFDRIFTFR